MEQIITHEGQGTGVRGQQTPVLMVSEYTSERIAAFDDSSINPPVLEQNPPALAVHRTASTEQHLIAIEISPAIDEHLKVFRSSPQDIATGVIGGEDP